MNKQFWKIFVVVFVVAFITNTAVSYLWSYFFHDSNLQWDTTTTIAAVVAGFVVATILNRKK
jgi:cytochrome c oxidase subunit IV